MKHGWRLTLDGGHAWGRDDACRKCGKYRAAVENRWLDWCPCWKMRLPKRKEK